MYPDQIELAYTADDVERIDESGKLVALIGIENGYVIGKDLSLLERYHELGARYITLAHGGHNDIADSSTPRENLGDGDTEHDGVSEFGETLIAEMYRLGPGTVVNLCAACIEVIEEGQEGQDAAVPCSDNGR